MNLMSIMTIIMNYFLLPCMGMFIMLMTNNYKKNYFMYFNFMFLNNYNINKY